MAGDVDNTRIWLGADVYVADLGTTAPTDTSSAWAAGWEPLGLLAEDGMTAGRTNEETEHWAWGSILTRVTRRRHKRTFVVTALEDNDTVFHLVNPGSTSATATGVTTRDVSVPQPDPRAFGFEVRDGDITKRIIVPRGEVTSVADVSFTDAEMSGYELTITVYPDSDGLFFVEITDDTGAAAPSLSS